MHSHMNNSASEATLQFLDTLINKWNVIQRVVHDYKDPLLFLALSLIIPSLKIKFRVPTSEFITWIKSDVT